MTRREKRTKIDKEKNTTRNTTIDHSYEASVPPIRELDLILKKILNIFTMKEENDFLCLKKKQQENLQENLLFIKMNRRSLIFEWKKIFTMI